MLNALMERGDFVRPQIGIAYYGSEVISFGDLLRKLTGNGVSTAVGDFLKVVV